MGIFGYDGVVVGEKEGGNVLGNVFGVSSSLPPGPDVGVLTGSQRHGL